MLPVLLLLLALLTLPLSIQSLSFLCAGNLYGKPRPADALALSKSLPYVKLDPDGNMDKVRIFAEPEFFTPRFHGLVNRWDTDMVQLPRVWRHRTARLSLLLYANPSRAVPSPAINSNWRTVQAAASGILQYCVGPSPSSPFPSTTNSSSSSSPYPLSLSQQPQPESESEKDIKLDGNGNSNSGSGSQSQSQSQGGVWIIADPATQTPYMSLFLYASGSPFEDVLNGYMVSGRGVNPFNPRGWGGGADGGNANISSEDVRTGMGMGMQELEGAVVVSKVEGV